MWLSQPLEPHPRGIDGAFRSRVNEQIVEESTERATEERGDHLRTFRDQHCYFKADD